MLLELINVFRSDTTQRFFQKFLLDGNVLVRDLHSKLNGQARKAFLGTVNFTFLELVLGQREQLVFHHLHRFHELGLGRGNRFAKRFGRFLVTCEEIALFQNEVALIFDCSHLRNSRLEHLRFRNRVRLCKILREVLHL